MKEAALKEYVERVGIVTRGDLLRQTGVAAPMLRGAMKGLVEKNELFICRLVGNRTTFLSRKLACCLRAICVEADLSADAQMLWDHLSDNEGAETGDLRGVSGLTRRDFNYAMRELQQALAVVPVYLRGLPVEWDSPEEYAQAQDADIRWATADTWFDKIQRPAHYADMGYCISEIRRLMGRYFSTRELDAIIYRRV